MTFEDIEKRIDKEDTACYKKLEREYNKLQEKGAELTDEDLRQIATIKDKMNAEQSNIEQLYIASFNKDKWQILKAFTEELNKHTPEEQAYKTYLGKLSMQSRIDNRPTAVAEDILQGGYKSFGSYLTINTWILFQAWVHTETEIETLIELIRARASDFFTPEENDNFIKVYETQAINEFGRLGNIKLINEQATTKYGNFELLNLEGTTEARTIVNKKGYRFSFPTECADKLSHATNGIIIDLIKHKLLLGIDKDIILTRAEYMEYRNITDIHTADKDFENFRFVCQKAQIDIETAEGRKGYFINMFDSILPSGSYDQDLLITLGDKFKEHILSGSVMPFPINLHRINNHKYPNAYYFGKKITELKHQQQGNREQDIISVRRLLESSPYIANSKEDISNRWNPRQKIIEPFERDMNALNKTLTWKYKEPSGKGKIIPKKQAQNLTYNEFINLNVVITWKDYPDQTDSIKRIKTKMKANKKASEGEK